MAKRPFHLAWLISTGYGPKAWWPARAGLDGANRATPDLPAHQERAAMVSS